MSFFPSQKDYLRNLKKKKNILIWKKVNSDLDTPVSAYLKICENNHNSFLLESVQDGTHRGRYSVIGMSPDKTWKCKNGIAYLKTSNKFVKLKDAPLSTLRNLIENSKIDFPVSLPPMSAGLVGYLSYETIELYENIPPRKKDSLAFPDGFFIRPKIMAIFDNIKNEVIIASPVWYTEILDIKKSYKDAIKLINNCALKLSSNIKEKKYFIKKPNKIKKPSSNISKKKFIDMIKKAKEYIYSGDIFQVVLSQRFKMSYKLPPFELYRSLRSLNPSPFLFYFDFKDQDSKQTFSLIGSSPEILVRLENNNVTIRPIAGTRPRGVNDAHDQRLKEDLLKDPKELAEHLMLLDLGRNDVGRVSKIGSVKVTEKMKVELYSHVMHIVSNVNGVAKKKYNLIDILMSGFPAGTVSGAPKIRALEIINELEPEPRGIYAGCVGYFSANGNMETCIVLRTAIIKNDTMYVQAGAGIVADSNPEKEYEETINKAKALFKAAEISYKR